MDSVVLVHEAQWNHVNTDTNGTCPSVRIKRVVRKNVTNTCFIEEKTLADTFFTVTNALIVLKLQQGPLNCNCN